MGRNQSQRETGREKRKEGGRGCQRTHQFTEHPFLDRTKDAWAPEKQRRANNIILGGNSTPREGGGERVPTHSPIYIPPVPGQELKKTGPLKNKGGPTAYFEKENQHF